MRRAPSNITFQLCLFDGGGGGEERGAFCPHGDGAVEQRSRNLKLESHFGRVYCCLGWMEGCPSASMRTERKQEAVEKENETEREGGGNWAVSNDR